MPGKFWCLGLIVVWLGSSITASARLGETTAQLTARYGPGKEAGDQMLYSAEELTLTVFFNPKGQSRMEIYGRRLLGSDKEREPLSAAQIAELLHENTQGARWQSFRPKSGSEMWRRSDGLALAEYKSNDRIFILMLTTPSPSDS